MSKLLAQKLHFKDQRSIHLQMKVKVETKTVTISIQEGKMSPSCRLKMNTRLKYLYQQRIIRILKVNKFHRIYDIRKQNYRNK